MHKKRIMEKIMEKCQISIMFVDDRHNGQSYHYFGRNQKRKNEANLLKMPDLVEFFNRKFLVIYWKVSGLRAKGFKWFRIGNYVKQPIFTISST